MRNRVPPLNLTAEEKKTLQHCIIAGEKSAIEHFGEEERERINAIRNKLGMTVDGGEA